MKDGIGLIIIALLTCSAAAAKHDGFSGTWLLDKDCPQPPNAPMDLKTKIKQKDSRVTLESTFREPAGGVVPLIYLGVMTERMKLATNGRPQDNRFGPFLMRTQTRLQGNQMITDWVAVVGKAQVDGHWTHTLKDADHLILEIRQHSATGEEREATLYLVRK